jgi:hypothetical protein
MDLRARSTARRVAVVYHPNATRLTSALKPANARAVVRTEPILSRMRTRTLVPSFLIAALLLAALAAGDTAVAVRADECEQQRADYPKDWNDVSGAQQLYRCQSHYDGALVVSLGAPDKTGRSLMSLVPIEGDDVTKPRIDDEHAIHHIWLDADQARRLKEGNYFATVVRTQESCWIRGDLSGDPVFFMDNANPPSDSEDAGAFYNRAPRVSVFKGSTYTCEPIK